MESPLEVLSRAASLLETDDRRRAENYDSGIEDSPRLLSSSENRRKRTHERNDISQILNFDDQHASKLSATKSKCAGTQTPPLGASGSPRSRIESSPPPLISIVPKTDGQVSYSYTEVSPNCLQIRPSVITSAHVKRHGYLDSGSPSPTSTDVDAHFARSVRTFVAFPDGAVDNVDEHFRRSLGEKYKLVAEKENAAECSVDEHFRKALGDAWNQVNNKPKVSHSPSSFMVQSIVSPAN